MPILDSSIFDDVIYDTSTIPLTINIVKHGMQVNNFMLNGSYGTSLNLNKSALNVTTKGINLSAGKLLALNNPVLVVNTKTLDIGLGYSIDIQPVSGIFFNGFPLTLTVFNSSFNISVKRVHLLKHQKGNNYGSW